MGLLMSDTMLTDPMVDETMRLLNSLAGWSCSLDAGREVDDRDGEAFSA